MTNFAPYNSDMRHYRGKRALASIVLIIFFGVFAWTCQDKKGTPDVLSKEQLSAIMIEFYLAEARLNNSGVKEDSATRLFAPFEDSVLAKAGVSDKVLRDTYQYYFDHPEELEKVYEILIDSLNLRERREMDKPRQ